MDNIPDDAALVFNTADGLVILTGCGHAGIEATMRLRQALGLNRHTAPVSSVGSSFTLHKGIDPGKLAA